MGVSKVVYGENTLVDLTADTVTAETLVEGATAHDAAGNAVTGTNPYAKEETDNTVNEQEQLIEEIVTALAERCVVTEPLLQAKTVTPSKTEQTVTADTGYDGLSSVTVEAAQSGEGTYGWKKATKKLLPSGYTEVEYIQSSGTQYINTGFKPNQDTAVVMDLAFTTVPTSVSGIFGCFDNSNWCWVWYNNSDSTYHATLGGTTQKTITDNTPTARTVLQLRTGFFSAGTQQVALPTSNFSIDYPIYLFAGNNGVSAKYQYPSSFRLYACQIYDNGTLVRDFVPCTNASGEARLYDRVNDVLYVNAGSGTFAVGSALESSVVGYVVSDDADAYPDGAFLDGYYYEKL